MYRRYRFYILIVLVIALVGVFFAGVNRGKQAGRPKIDGNLISNKLYSAKELTTVKYRYTNMGAFENQNTFYGYKIPFTDKKFIVSYDGIINAGVDLDKSLKVSVDKKNIVVTIDHSEILSHEILEDSLKVYNEKTSIFNPIKVEDYNEFSKEEKKRIERDVIDKGLLKEADEKAKEAITEILKIDTFLKDYNIEVKFK